MKYIDSLDDYNQLISSVANKNIVILPTFVNHKIHYVRNKPSLLFIRNLDDYTDFVIGISHPDLFHIPIERLQELKPSEIWTIDQKRLLSILDNMSIIDINMFYYLSKNNTPEWILDTPIHLLYQRKYSSAPDVNNIIPAAKHIELHQINAEKISYILGNFNSPEALLYYRSTLYTISQLERTGILIDPIKFKSHYGDSISPHISPDNYIYSEYNFFTATGRPSNRYGNINFAAIEKKDGVRRAFIPRYDNFILFDFSSFHLSLIAKLMDFKFEIDDIHTYLGQYYFGKKTLTSDEYEEAKKLNFKYLYGGIPTHIKNSIPYFDEVQKFTYMMWNKMRKDKFYESPLTGRKIRLEHIENPNPTKVLNYFIQLMETETNMVFIDRLQKYLQNFKTKLILYTYDSFLFDYSSDDGQECIIGIKQILDIFPTKVYFGKNYQDMLNVTETLNKNMK